MENTLFIYELIDTRTNETRYIGKTKDAKARLEMHLDKDSLLGNNHRENWIKLLLSLKLKPVINVIDKVPKEEINFWKTYYIALYKTWGCFLTNGTKGGDGGDTLIGKSEEEKLEIRRKQSISNTGIKKRSRTEEEKQHSREVNTGRVQTQKTKLKRVESRITNPSYKWRILQLTLDGVLVKDWDCFSKILTSNPNWNYSQIKQSLKIKENIAYGFKWKYKG